MPSQSGRLFLVGVADSHLKQSLTSQCHHTLSQPTVQYERVTECASLYCLSSVRCGFGNKNVLFTNRTASLSIDDILTRLPYSNVNECSPWLSLHLGNWTLLQIGL